MASTVQLACMGGAYGNIPALEACLVDARARGCHRLAFLGDAIGCCGHSDAVIDLIRGNFDVLVAGNHEQKGFAGSASCGCGYASVEDERIGCLAFQRARDSLRADQRRWLGTWPDRRILVVGGDRILLCHGSPRQTNEFLYESTVSEEQCLVWLDEAGAAAMVCTHTGLPWIKEVAPHRWAVNCGVVGKPDHDGDPAVHYALLSRVDGRWRAQIQTVEYDYERWAGQLDQEGVDPVFVEPLRTGIWLHGVDSLPPADRHRMPGPLDDPAERDAK